MSKPFLSRAVAILCLAAVPVCAAGAAAISVHVANTSGAPLPDAVVYLEAETVAGHTPSKTQKVAEIEQKGLKFLPPVTVVQTGSRIEFPNNDKVRHHIYSFSPAHKFDQKLYSGTSATPQIFDKAGVVVLGCNIHDKMVAYVRVVDTPYFGKTDVSGLARVELPAAGKYLVKVWHFNMAGGQSAEQAVTLKAGDAEGTATFRLAMKPPSSGDGL